MLMIPECLSSALIKPPLLINPCGLTGVNQNSIMLLSQQSGGSHRGGGDAAPLTGFTASKGSCQDTWQERKLPPTPSPPPRKILLALQGWYFKGSTEKVIRFASINTALVWQLNFLTDASASQSTFADCWRVPWVGPNGLRHYWYTARTDNCDFNAGARTKRGSFQASESSRDCKFGACTITAQLWQTRVKKKEEKSPQACIQHFQKICKNVNFPKGEVRCTNNSTTQIQQ